MICFILPKPEDWTQLRSLPLSATLCLLPRASSSKFSGHTGGAKAFPEAEVIKQEKTKLCFQRAGFQRAQPSLCDQLVPGYGRPKETQQETTGPFGPATHPATCHTWTKS